MEQFSQLSPADKVEAVLVAAMQPVSQQVALKWAGVDIDSLDDDAACQVKAVFKRWILQDTDPTAPLYVVP